MEEKKIESDTYCASNCATQALIQIESELSLVKHYKCNPLLYSLYSTLSLPIWLKLAVYSARAKIT